MNEKTRVQNQDDWKRTQIRIPIGLYGDLVEYAEQNNLSLNTAMIELMDKGLGNQPNDEMLSRIHDLTEEVLELSRESREMRMLYVEAMNDNFENLPTNLRSKYGKIIKTILEEKAP
ncbi:hypothetical protein [Acinetobacter sp. TUM15064]|uniref:hypothetical protein n=1 Tax=Acinetobacter sp. TUM15064 TaxID=2609134 RepID=UPI00124E2443|nr:hypothetical protein [Acinetobacter sp. TUM15064]